MNMGLTCFCDANSSHNTKNGKAKVDEYKFSVGIFRAPKLISSPLGQPRWGGYATNAI